VKTDAAPSPVHSIKDRVELNNRVMMPWLGFGVYQMSAGGEVETAVRHALAAGYRSFDTASFYGNERGLGRALRRSGLPREEIFLTTKVWNDDQRARRVRESFDESLARLETEYVDLYLIHWPVRRFIRSTWDTLEEIYARGGARAIRYRYGLCYLIAPGRCGGQQFDGGHLRQR
jgi:diketogulonate reductase-like aldo/keto reductase